MDPALRQKLDLLPAEPGCYLMKDRAGEVVYVGKAASLRSRVRSYFDAGRGDDRIFVPLLDDLLGDVEVIVTRSEKEAVLLENELIKKHKPRFNVRLRDDKDFIVLRLDERHPFPRLEVRRARERRDPQARYFGPYSSASSIRETLRIVNRHFQLRTCSDHVFDHRRRPCILYQIKRCPAPCVYEVPAPEYRQSVEDAVEFLEGRESELVERLRSRMREAAGALRFEEAGRVRDQLQVAALITKKGLSVREAEALASRLKDPPKDKKTRLSHELKAVEEKLQKALGTKVSIASKSKGGRIVIEYYSSEELDRILEKII